MRSSSVAVRALSLLLFLLLVGVMTYWAMQLLAPRAAIAPSDSLGDNSRPPLPVAARLFGAQTTSGAAPEAPPPVNIKVTGILESGRHGVAILAIDGKPAKAYRVSQSIGHGSTLKEVHLDKVVIDHRGQRIEAPAPARYSLDILTSNTGKSSPPSGIESVPPVDATVPPVPVSAPASNMAAEQPTLPDNTLPPEEPPMVPPDEGAAPMHYGRPLRAPTDRMQAPEMPENSDGQMPELPSYLQDLPADAQELKELQELQQLQQTQPEIFDEQGMSNDHGGMYDPAQEAYDLEQQQLEMNNQLNH